MPDIIFPNLDALPEELRPFAKDVEGGNGGVVVNLVANDKLREFRENNIKVSKERDDLSAFKAGVSAIFPEFDGLAIQAELEDLRKTSQLVKDGTLKESKDIDNVVGERTKQMKGEYDQRIAEARNAQKLAEQGRQVVETKLRNQIVKQAIVTAAMDERAGVHPDAIDDIVSRAYSVFQVEGDDRLVPKVGDSVLYGSDGTTAMSVGEWITSLKERSRHLFRQSNGGGGAGAGGERSFGGFTPKEVEKMSPEQKLALANEMQRPKGVR